MVLPAIASRIAVMLVSSLARAKRAFVSVLLSVAAAYGVSLQVNRESEDEVLLDEGDRKQGCCSWQLVPRSDLVVASLLMSA